MQATPFVVGPAWLLPVPPLCCTVASAPVFLRNGSPGFSKIRCSPGPYPDPGMLMESPITSTFGVALDNGAGGLPQEPAAEPVDTGSGSMREGSGSELVCTVLLLIALLGILRMAASATEIPVYCWPEGAGFVLKKWSPVV